uniref:Tetratricopeptide repeat protein n=1 Tax=Panagrolaimus sp. ES5 TaxID=591445 RepID=A0AC34FUW0_9BILA
MLNLIVKHFDSRTSKCSNPWNKSDKHLSSKFLNVHCDVSERTDSKKARSASATNSTFSLHIAAYENSTEDANDSDGGEVEKEKLGLIRKWQKAKEFVSGSSSVIQNSFDFPPQQENEDTRTPEKMQFKRSFNLFNPNKLSPPKPTEYQRLKVNANELFKAKRFNEAVRAYSDILKYTSLTNEQRALIHSNRCAAYFLLLSEKNSLRCAKKDAVKVIQLNPTWWKGHYRLGLCHSELEEWKDAQASFTKALELNENSSEIISALNVAEKGLMESKLNYQQRRSLNQKDVLHYRNPFFYDSDDEELSEAEVKRSGDEFSGEFDEYYANLYRDTNDDSFHSLNSDRPDGNNSEIITLESSAENIVDEEVDKNAFVQIDKADLTLIAKQVYGFEDSHQGYIIQSSAPYLPPNKKGTYVCIINANHIDKLPDLRDDQLSPWTNSENKYNIDKLGLFKTDGIYKAITRKVEGADKHIRFCRMTHPELKIKKRIYWDYNPNTNDSPMPGTFIVILYEIEDEFALTEDHLKKKRRLSKAASAKLDTIIIGRTGKETSKKYYENGGMMTTDKNHLPDITQIRNKIARSKRWEPPTKKGRPRNEDQEKLKKLVEEHFIVRAYYIGDDISEERFIGSKICGFN